LSKHKRYELPSTKQDLETTGSYVFVVAGWHRASPLASISAAESGGLSLTWFQELPYIIDHYIGYPKEHRPANEDF
jgi:hypothetical protein